ncbi:SWIM zinc finger family protein [Mycobacterium kansasii 732]|nr:SWIM zinc finger family protein [Mycobacterium kansasii 732]
MQSLMYPSIDLDDAASHLGADTYRRGLDYAREGRVVRCSWNPGDDSLTGSVRGNRGRTYTTTAQLSMDDADSWNLEIGLCTCPVQVDCKHVAAVLIAASGTTKTRSQRPSAAQPVLPAPAAWRTSLDSLFPTSSPASTAGTPLAIELNLSASGLDARVVRPGKRGGWVAADLSWGRLSALRHYGYPDAHLHALQEFYAAYRAGPRI